MNVLDRICADTRAEVARRRAATPIEVLQKRLDGIAPPRGFARALMASTGRFALIAEIKKASPSGGLIRPHFDPPALARAYRDGGATCLSVLTDGPHFQGDPDHLAAARVAVALPVLRKDFFLDPWQVYESRMIGADCILLILAALTDAEAAELERVANELGMDVLAEVHDADELRRALKLKTKLIGINNRNLKTLQTDINTSMQLAPALPTDRFPVAESGLRTNSDLQRLGAIGINAFLVGESLLRHDDVAAAARELLAA